MTIIVYKMCQKGRSQVIMFLEKTKSGDQASPIGKKYEYYSNKGNNYKFYGIFLKITYFYVMVLYAPTL